MPIDINSLDQLIFRNNENINFNYNPKNGHAFALKVEERFLGNNNLLNIKLKSYYYDVVLIDKWGKVIEYLAGPFPVAVSEKKLNIAPPIVARCGLGMILLR